MATTEAMQARIAAFARQLATEGLSETAAFDRFWTNRRLKNKPQAAPVLLAGASHRQRC